MTQLQQAIEDMIQAHPELDDKAIAEAVWLQDHPTEPYQNISPSHTYVGKVRGRLQFKSQAPEVHVEPPEDEEEPTILPDEKGEGQPFNPEAFPKPEEEPEEKDLQLPGEEFTAEDGEFLIVFTFDKLADVTGYTGWKLDPTDRSEKRFIAIGSKMIEKYVLPNLEKYWMEVMFCYTGLMVVAPRIGGYRRFREAQKPLIDKTKEQASPSPDKETPKPASQETQPTPEPPLPPGLKVEGENEMKKRLGK